MWVVVILWLWQTSSSGSWPFGIIPGNRRPTTAMAWLLGIFFVPFLGIVLFLLFGNFRLSSRRREQQQQVNDRVRCGHHVPLRPPKATTRARNG